jgi:hypothetical protein
MVRGLAAGLAPFRLHMGPGRTTLLELGAIQAVGIVDLQAEMARRSFDVAILWLPLGDTRNLVGGGNGR